MYECVCVCAHGSMYLFVPGFAAKVALWCPAGCPRWQPAAPCRISWSVWWWRGRFHRTPPHWHTTWPEWQRSDTNSHGNWFFKFILSSFSEYPLQYFLMYLYSLFVNLSSSKSLELKTGQQLKVPLDTSWEKTNIVLLTLMPHTFALFWKFKIVWFFVNNIIGKQLINKLLSCSRKCIGNKNEHPKNSLAQNIHIYCLGFFFCLW